MKIRLKGFKSLTKAVRNRAHLFPVKVLIRAKSKTYYGIRYKTGNKAMEFTKKQMKIPNTVEVLFDTIDGKRKNLTENDVLRIYDKAGKPGSLQEFIEKNFKKPHVKPRNSTKVDLEQQQISIDDLMERNKKAKEPEKSLIEIAEEKARKLKENPQPIDPRVGNTEPYKSRVTKEQVEEAKAFFNDKNTEIFPYDKGVRDDEEQFSDKEVVDAANFRMRMILEYNKEIEHEKNGLSNPYLNKESLVRNYKYYKIFNDILLNREEVAYWNEALKEGRTELYKLQKFDERYMAKKRLEEKKKRKEQKQENSNSTNPLETEILNTLGIKLNNKSDTTKLKPKFNALKKLIGKKGDVINGKPLTERASKEIDQILKNATFNLDEMKISVESGNNYLQNLLDEALNRKVEELEHKQKAEEERAKYKAEIESYEGKEIILSRQQENAVRSVLGAAPKKNKGDNWIYPSNEALESIIGLKDGKLNGEKITDTEVVRLRNQYYNGHFNLLTGEFTKNGKSDSPIQKQITDYINNLIEDIKNSPDEEIEKLAFRTIGMDGGLINFIKTREGTTKIESKNEYRQIKNVNELVDQVKPIKDAHTNIKGRAIMDMFGIGADLITKADSKPFPIGPGANGYCSRYYNPETGEASIKEIGIVADRNNSYEETQVTIHECMHAKLTLSGKNNLMDSIYTSGTKGEKIILKVEEPMVELAGHAVARQIHGDEANKSLHAYATFIADFLPRVWTSDIFKNVRKQGALGIGQEIAKQLTDGNTDFINKVYDSFNANDDKKANSNRMKAIETKMLERTDKVEKIQNDTGVSSIANLVEELKRGTISLEGALNSGQYRELAAVLIAKFLEDEDLEALEGLALSF